MPPRTAACPCPGEVPFDFDAWKSLAEEDPDAFFRERARLIATFIAANPDSAESLRALQGRIDRMRALSGSPHIALNALMEIIAERLSRLIWNMEVLRDEVDPRPGPQRALNVDAFSPPGSSSARHCRHKPV